MHASEGSGQLAQLLWSRDNQTVPGQLDHQRRLDDRISSRTAPLTSDNAEKSEGICNRASGTACATCASWSHSCRRAMGSRGSSRNLNFMSSIYDWRRDIGTLRGDADPRPS